VGLGAVIAISANRSGSRIAGDSILRETLDSDQAALLNEGLECVEVCGRSLVERSVERFTAIGVDRISILVDAGVPMPALREKNEKVTVQAVEDLGPSIASTIKEHALQSIDHSFIIRGDNYTETDLLDLFSFHREARQEITPTYCKAGDLALWVVNCAKARETSLANLLEVGGRGSRYFIREYVSCLNDCRDLRRFASEVLRGVCETRPSGRQIRPGVWIDEGAEVHRRARIVAPAYIGRGARIRADALITRLTSIEEDCVVDCGTVIEDSSILANTSVGICLDLCHAVVSGNKLLSLERDVVVEISDAAVLHSTVASRRLRAGIKPASVLNEPSVVTENRTRSPQLNPMLDTWQWEKNFIQE